MINRKKLSTAVHSALVLSAGAMMASTASAQEAAKPEVTKTLDSVQVTGSRIKRVDSETASPVFQLNKADIEKTGALTIGDFLQDIPAISGAATNPSVNNGGGTGEATISLRGLGDERTLILVNGRRIVTNDVNSIPMSMVETVEVLKDGASAIYGSDAIGGVVNFILKSNFDGLEFRADVGISSRNDGQRTGGSMTWGATGDRGNIIIGLNYSKQEEVRASARDFSYYALSLGSTSSTGVVQGGSSRALTGRYFINANPVLKAYYGGCNSVTRIDANSGGNALSDFRCFSFGRDSFNYQAVGNLELTPQERTGVFVSGNFDLTDNITAYVDAFANKTRSASQIAPLPFDGLSDGVSLSKYSQYNPWGVAAIGATDAVDINDIRLRLSRLGNRRYEYTTSVYEINAGLKGNFDDSSWSWDYNLSYGKIDQDNSNQGYIDAVGLAKALGPSQNGVCYTDGTYTTVVAGCVPVDFVGVYDPTSASTAALNDLVLNLTNKQVETYKGFQANFSGDLFDWKPGTVQAAFGVEYRENSLEFNPADVAIVDPNAGYTCAISSELCTAPTKGTVKVKEIYGELLIPLASTLNMTIGSRWSDYNTFGSTVNSKIGLEWRPSDQLLFRGTYAEVFRAPTINDLYGGLAAASDGFTDPCNGIKQLQNPALPFNAVTNPYIISTNPACANVLADGTFSQTDSQLNAIKGGTDTLKPEEGDVTTIGIVYEPSWLEGFSTTVDFWQVKLDNSIGTIGTQNLLNVCFNTTAANPSPLCQFFSRRPSGEVEILFDRRANVGSLETAGVDVGFKYRMDSDWGKWRFSVDATYTDKYDVDVIYNGEVVQSQQNAGTFLSVANGGNGNYSQWRALGNIGWSHDIWDVSWTMRFVDGFTVGSTDVTGTCANLGLTPGSPGCQFSIGAYTYHNIQAGVTLDKLKLRIGIDNVNDKQPPLLYQNNSLNGNTDERTFDTVGRYYWSSITYSF